MRKAAPRLKGRRGESGRGVGKKRFHFFACSVCPYRVSCGNAKNNIFANVHRPVNQSDFCARNDFGGDCCLVFAEVWSFHSVWFRLCCRVATPDYCTSRGVCKSFLFRFCILFPSPEKERRDEKRLARGPGWCNFTSSATTKPKSK